MNSIGRWALAIFFLSLIAVGALIAGKYNLNSGSETSLNRLEDSGRFKSIGYIKLNDMRRMGMIYLDTKTGKEYVFSYYGGILELGK